MSKANDIAAALAARLQGISIAAGYATDAGKQVLRGAATLDETKLPGIIVVEQEDQIERQRLDSAPAAVAIDTDVLLPFVIEATGPCDPSNPAIAGHALVADIKRAVFSGDLTWGDLATHTRYIGRTLHERTPGDSLVTVTVKIRIGCVENLANP